ncbi:hypothetical protein [Parachitinimonas caeni]|uniref:DUF5666 domain-containing protein n=1 Tax=Parachitinimonas caeni TaxID=3031301 RepID=A0ABT7E0C8_9NEIS|nr:hypothetical protein [Parachitinimonas caeni]MDK2125760.1 hypothetical protein [Parachitinimonas caeni]
MNKNAKVVVLGGVIALGMAAGTANAAGSAAADAKGADFSFSATAGNFVVSGFKMKLSNNVGLNAADNATAVAVSAASLKGTRVFGGSSNGGGVKDCTGSSKAAPTPIAPGADKDGCSA